MIRYLTGAWLLATLLFSSAALAGGVTVFAAASLKGALDEAAAGWQAATGHKATISFAGSSALARQIAAGAPAEVFVSANTAWMDTLDARGLVVPGSRRDLLGNRLVLIGGIPDMVALAPGLDLAGLLGDGYLAMALVDAVPAGIYGKAALQSLGLWDSVADRVAQADNVRAAMALVARGEAPLGIVYATDAMAEPGVRVLGVFPEASHPPIRYPVAVIDGAGPLAAAFLDYLDGPEAMAVFIRHGFTAPGAGP